jgi:hypothetical protein
MRDGPVAQVSSLREGKSRGTKEGPGLAIFIPRSWRLTHLSSIWNHHDGAGQTEVVVLIYAPQLWPIRHSLSAEPGSPRPALSSIFFSISARGTAELQGRQSPGRNNARFDGAERWPAFALPTLASPSRIDMPEPCPPPLLIRGRRQGGLCKCHMESDRPPSFPQDSSL